MIVLKKILRLREQEDLGADVVTVVFDRYDKDDSIKQMERPQPVIKSPISVKCQTTDSS